MTIDLSGPKYFDCGRQYARMKKADCVQMQRKASLNSRADYAYNHHCRTCAQGQVIKEEFQRESQQPKQGVKDRTKKSCPKCKQVFPRDLLNEYFYINRRRRGGFQSWCKACHKKYDREKTRKEKSMETNKRETVKKREFIETAEIILPDKATEKDVLFLISVDLTDCPDLVQALKDLAAKECRYMLGDQIKYMLKKEFGMV